jgi:hypothetical protein
MGWDGIDMVDMIQERDQLESSCEHDNEPLGSVKY